MTTPLKMMHVRNNYDPLEMTRTETHTHTKSKPERKNNRVELKPGDDSFHISPAPRGLVSSTYDASTSFSWPWMTLTRVVAQLHFQTHDVLKYEV